jgi:hypothetical protein
MVAILQGMASLTGFAALAAAAAALSVLVLCWAFGARGSPLGRDLKTELVDTDAPPSSPEPPDADLGLDFEAFQSGVERECDLALSRLCDDAVDDQVLRSLAEDLASQAPFDQEFDCEGVDSAQGFEAFQPGTERECDPRLCDDAVGGRVLRSLEDDLADRAPFDQQVACVGVDSAPAEDPAALDDGLCFEDDLKTFGTRIDQHCDLALKGVLDLAIDAQCDMVLKDMEGEREGPIASDDEALEDTLGLEEVEEALSRQAEEARSLCADSPLNETLQEYHEQLLHELQMVNQAVPRKSLHELIAQHLRRARSLYLLWVI